MKIVFAILLILSPFSDLCGQAEGQLSYVEILSVLKKEIKNGQHRTLRDIISLLDRPEISAEVRAILEEYTFFTEKEIDVKTANKEDLLGFYYDHLSLLKHSDVLNAFYITPIEEGDVNFELKHTDSEAIDQTGGILRRLLTELNEFLERKKYNQSEKVILEIVDLDLSDVEVYLNILKDSRLLDSPESVRNKIYQALISSLDTYYDLEVAEIALQMLEADFLDEAFVIPFLSAITNNPPDTTGRFENTPDYYLHLIDSLGTMEEIRTYGYKRHFNTRISFFQFPVDYYGKLLVLCDSHPSMKKNIILDLQKTQHPRAFFYIAADLYRNLKEDSGFKKDFYLKTLRNMSNVKVGIKGKNNEITFDPKQDEMAMFNYFLFWATHYEDFEWDDNRKIFTNKLETMAKTQDYERLFRRLNSRNDTVAMESFVQLTEGDHLEIKTLAKKYRQLLRNQNTSLPSLKYQYLEQLTLLTGYCRLNNIPYKVQPALAEKLLLLLAAKNHQEQYRIENLIIEEMGIDEVTAFEYWACLKESNMDLTFSVGRILDWFYSENWDKILKDKKQVRLFLKKSYLFENIGVSGICNAYLNKFDMNNDFERRIIEEISKSETDEDILNQISLLLTSPVEDKIQTYDISDFLADPLVFNRRDIKILPEPTDKIVRQIVDIIKKEEEQEVIKKLFSYLWLHPDINYIPYLFELIDDERIITQREDITVSVADNIIPIVENVYSHNFKISAEKPFATAQWRELWKKDGDEFEIWEKKFFENNLDSLKYYETLDIEQLNNLTASEFFTAEHKPILLSYLKKVKPMRDIRRLNMEPKLSLEEDLKYFKDFYFSYKELDDIPKLFDITEENVDLMLDYIKDKTDSFEASEKGSIYNNLLRTPWLTNYVMQGKLKPGSAKRIEEALTTYLNESEFMSEFEDQLTQLNIAQLQFMGKSIHEKINVTLAMNADIGSKAKILKSIIATIKYEEIGLVVSRFDEIHDILGEGIYDFLSKDFGIPVYSFDTMEEQEVFIQNHAKMSPYNFYAFYLKKFGIDVFLKWNRLDYQKIYNILRYDNVSPFLGETAGKRDLYTYALIKLLEYKFDTRLGFHEKLNESQNFYTFTTQKRAQAWMKFLEDENLINLNKLIPSSFNAKKEEI